MMRIIDTHCHLDYLESATTEEIIETCKKLGIEKMVTVAVSPDNQDQVLSLTTKFDSVFCSQGVHPHEASAWTKECREKIITNLQDKNVVAIGEIGLDYHYEHSPRDIQKNIFEEQLQIAIDHDLPIIIHTREAEEDTLAILKNFKKTISNNVVLHSYTSGKELATFAIENDYYLGFNGIITFKAAANVRDVLHITPLKNLVVETDAPYLAQVPFRGRENSPQYLPQIIEYMAKEKNIGPEELAKILLDNSTKLFHII